MKRLYNLPNKIIAVTGGIASGKTYKCKQLEAEGEDVIYADKIVKKVYKTWSFYDMLYSKVHMKTELYDVFINGSYDDDSVELDFKKLRKIAFSDLRILRILEDWITDHFEGEFLKEYMEKGLNKALYNCEEGSIDYPDIYFEYAPERLIDINLFDEVIRCEAPKDIRIERIIKRDGCSRELAIQMIERQES